MYIHIGEQIKQRAKELRMGPTELSSLVNTTKQNIYGIYKRKSIDSDLLLRFSIILDFDFFQLYSQLRNNVKNDVKIESAFNESMPKVSSQHDILKNELDSIRKENEMKDKMIKLLEDKINKHEHNLKKEEKYLNILKSRS
ncbi:MAG: hypothetical protein WC223_09025 [Bacteroidales bacterium]|jgi:septin family protein